MDKLTTFPAIVDVEDWKREGDPLETFLDLGHEVSMEIVEIKKHLRRIEKYSAEVDAVIKSFG